MTHFDLAKFWSGRGEHDRAFGFWVEAHKLLAVGHARGLGRWRAYERGLAPLLAALGAAEPRPASS